MADMLIRTRPITRDKLATFLKSHELIKAFEALTQDVGETIPDGVIEAINTADRANRLATLARAAAVAAQSAAAIAQQAIDDLENMIGMDSAPAIQGFQAAQLHALSDRIAAIEEGPL